MAESPQLYALSTWIVKDRHSSGFPFILSIIELVEKYLFRIASLGLPLEYIIGIGPWPTGSNSKANSKPAKVQDKA